MFLSATRTLRGGVIAIASITICSCSDPSSPSSPSEVQNTPAAVSKIIVAGTPPPLGTSSQFTAVAVLPDGSTRTVTSEATWSSSNASVASVSSGGLVTAVSSGSVEITATYAQTKGSLTFTVQPAVTYRLSGTIRDAVSGAGLAATVAVKQAGTVTNSATADSSGRYSIAGIAPGAVEVTAAAADYVPVITSFTILSDRTLDFALRPAAPCPSIGFDTLQPHDADFTTYASCGFTVTATTSNWKISTGYGKPAPFIQFRTPANVTAVGEILVTSAGSAFRFRSVDLYSSTTPIPYVITGIANGATVLSIQNTQGNTFGNFATIANPQPTTPIDALLIRLSNPATCCGNPMGIDNIQLAY